MGCKPGAGSASASARAVSGDVGTGASAYTRFHHVRFGLLRIRGSPEAESAPGTSAACFASFPIVYMSTLLVYRSRE
jgi:hypothetical protein